MITYAEFQPTSFDHHVQPLFDRSNWLVAPVMRTRDSNALERSNFAAMIHSLQRIGPEGELSGWEVHRSGHWGPGYFEIILVKPSSPASREAENAENILANDPILDEADYSEREWEGACSAWAGHRVSERAAICAKHGVSIFAARRDEIPQGLPYYDDFYNGE